MAFTKYVGACGHNSNGADLTPAGITQHRASHVHISPIYFKQKACRADTNVALVGQINYVWNWLIDNIVWNRPELRQFNDSRHALRTAIWFNASAQFSTLKPAQYSTNRSNQRSLYDNDRLNDWLNDPFNSNKQFEENKQRKKGGKQIHCFRSLEIPRKSCTSSKAREMLMLYMMKSTLIQFIYEPPLWIRERCAIFCQDQRG